MSADNAILIKKSGYALDSPWFDRRCRRPLPALPIAVGGTKCIARNTNSYRFTSWFDAKDVILNWEGNIVRRRDDADLMEYRTVTKKKFDEYYK